MDKKEQLQNEFERLLSRYTKVIVDNFKDILNFKNDLTLFEENLASSVEGLRFFVSQLVDSTIQPEPAPVKAATLPDSVEYLKAMNLPAINRNHFIYRYTSYANMTKASLLLTLVPAIMRNNKRCDIKMTRLYDGNYQIQYT